MTGYGILINTSFNVKDEPIVCTPEDAWRCFTNTNIDGLVIGNYYFEAIPKATYNAAYDRLQTASPSR